METLRENFPPRVIVEFGMIHIVIGTKAQFIKMAPVMVALERAKRRYRVVDLSQHGRLGQEMLRSFSVDPEVYVPLPRATSVSSIAGGIGWMIRVTFTIAFRRRFVRREIFGDQGGVAIVHGDTMSTLLGAWAARRNRLPVALVEAGLRSRSLLYPFPEEIIRRLVERWCEVLYAPSDAETMRLKNRYRKKHIVNTGYNTGRDALALIAHHGSESDLEPLPIVTIHRLETLSSRRRLQAVVELVVGIATFAGRLRFVMHPPTEKALKRFDLMTRVTTSPFIECLPLQKYDVFAQHLRISQFIMTDGGSIQEEASYLNKPCIILRECTERGHGLGDTARLTSWDATSDWEFLRARIGAKPSEHELRHSLSASQKIVETLSEKYASVSGTSKMPCGN